MNKDDALNEIDYIMNRVEASIYKLKTIKRNMPGHTYYAIKGCLEMVEINLTWAIPQLHDEDEEDDE